MIKATIQVNGKYYAGEDVGKTYDVEKPALTSGFAPNNNRQVDKLKWAKNREEAYQAYGARGINSALQKIEQRMRMELIPKDANIEIKTLSS